MSKKNILCVGVVVLDIVTEIDHFPLEDSENRCQKLWRQRGGNASNNCTVLGILGITPHFLGVITDNNDQKFVEEDFKYYGVNTNGAIIDQDSECPTSCIINSLATGSRTIIHYNKNLRELTLNDFLALDLNQYEWIHFEGRNGTEVTRMIETVHKFNSENEKKIRISVELEKPRSMFDQLLPLADVVFVSKDYAKFRGWNNMHEALSNLANIISNDAMAICPWGEMGAGSITNPSRSLYFSSSFSPSHIVDTLGAGDTFIASTILALMAGESEESSIIFGCKIAGFKVGLRGWSEFREKIHELHDVKKIIDKYHS